MPRPLHKQDLLQHIRRQHKKLAALIRDLSDEDLCTVRVTTKWSTKDVLAHLSEWSRMVLSWHEIGLQGEKPALPREGYNWRQIPALNQAIYEEHKNDTLEQVKEAFEASYEQMLVLAESLSEQELFERAYYSWTNNNNFATYLISASSSHYNWASIHIRRAFKEKLKEQRHGKHKNAA